MIFDLEKMVQRTGHIHTTSCRHKLLAANEVMVLITDSGLPSL